MIQRTARLPELLAGLPASLGSPEILPLARRHGDAYHTILLRARKGGRAALRLLPGLPIHGDGRQADGKDFAPWVAAVLRDGAALPWR